MNLKHISVKIDEEIYNLLIKKTINKTNKEKRIVNLSEIIREELIKSLKNE